MSDPRVILRRIGWLVVKLVRIGWMRVFVRRYPLEDMKVKVVPIGGLRVRYGIVYAVDLNGQPTGILWASDGRLITLEGGYLIVR